MMKIHECIQGSPEWTALRHGYHTASEASAMLGVSKYQTRTDLLRQKATGLIPEVSDETQALFDRGHAAEAGAREIAEDQIGEDLYPTTVTAEVDGLPLLASLDGMTMDGDVLWEHKLYSESLAEQIRQGAIDPHYRAQLDQQLLVTGATRVLFMCSDGTREKCAWTWYERHDGQYIIDGWRQFAVDLKNYQHIEEAPKPDGKAPETLPALRIELTGMVTASNLAEFKETALTVINAVNTDLQTDQDFANADKAVKWCGEVESRLEAAKQHALSQTSSIDELFRTLDAIKAEARTKRLYLEKLVKARKDSIRIEIAQGAVQGLVDHYLQINSTLKYQLGVPSDFRSMVVEAMKGKRTVSSLRDAADTVLVSAKIAASKNADRMRMNLKFMEQLQDYAQLYPDVGQLASAKDPDDFQAIIKARLAEHKEKEQARLEADRERIRREEEAKALRVAEAERERIRKEEQAKALKAAEVDSALMDATIRSQEAAKNEASFESQRGSAADATHAGPKATARPQAPAASTPPIQQAARTRPTDAEIIEVLALHYRVHELKVVSWLYDMDLDEASASIARAEVC